MFISKTLVIKLKSMDKSYYQITAIDEFSRKRILEIVDEKKPNNEMHPLE